MLRDASRVSSRRLDVRASTVGVAVVVAALALTACTSSSGTSPSSSPTSSGVSTGPTAPASSVTPPKTTSPTTSSAKPALARFSSVTGTSTTLRFDPAFVRALYTHALTSRPTGRATLTPVGKADDARLPVSGGSATVYATPRTASSTMTLRHSGSGLTVSSATRSVRVTDLVLTFGATPGVTATVTTVRNGVVGASSTVQLFSLKPTAALAASSARGVVTVTGIRTYLTATAVRTLSSALDTTAFGSGAASYIGTLTMVIRGS